MFRRAHLDFPLADGIANGSDQQIEDIHRPGDHVHLELLDATFVGPAGGDDEAVEWRCLSPFDDFGQEHLIGRFGERAIHWFGFCIHVGVSSHDADFVNKVTVFMV